MFARARGFTLIEVLVATVLLGIIGVALTRLLITESRLFDLQNSRRNARAVGRASTNVLFSDLRMAHDGASAPGTVLIAKRDSLRIRLPYVTGFVCSTGSVTTAGLLPSDSAVIAMSSYAGYAWRDRPTSRYTYVPLQSANMPTGSSAPGNCFNNARLRVDDVNGRQGVILDLLPSAAGAQPGAPMFLYQEVTYWFGMSTAYSGRVGLFRQATGGAAEELVAPFANTAGFKFYTRNADVPSTTPPTILDSLVGVAIVLDGASPSNLPGSSPVRSQMETSVFFRNRRNP
jgi:prepilin-type N-terminal cleavage/methylation domain-containing protein